MPQKRYRPEQIIAKLHEAEVLLGQGKKVPDAVKAIGIVALHSGQKGGSPRRQRARSRFMSIVSLRGIEETPMRHHGQSIRQPLRPEHAALPQYPTWHRDQVFKGRARFLNGVT